MKEIGIMRIIGLSAAMLALVACSGDDVVGDASGRCVLTLDAQVEQAVTRAGQTGVMDNTTLATTGFGLFAYEPIGTELFNNKHVTYNQSDTPSEPLGTVHLHPVNWKYWDDGGSYMLWEKDKTYSFYAYAPYVASTSLPDNEGITAITSTSTGPTIAYTVAATPANSVDLLWGVNGATGLPWLSQTRESNGGLVLFNFHHALAAVGFHAQAMVDKENNLADLTDEGDNAKTGILGTDCKVTIKSITLTRISGTFYNSGILCLKNTTANQPLWNVLKAGSNALSLSTTVIDSKLLDPAPADNSAMATFMGDDANPGVTATANSQLIIAKNADKEQYFLLIPETGTIDYDCTVEYYVTYVNTNAASGYTRLDYTGSNAGHATITRLPLQAGIKYYINLVFSLHTFGLDVTATDWNNEPVDIGITVENGTSANSSLSRRPDRKTWGL